MALVVAKMKSTRHVWPGTLISQVQRFFLFFLFSVERTDLKISNEPKSLFATADSKTSIMTVNHSYNLANKSLEAS